MSSFHSSEHHEEAQQAEGVADQEREASTARLDELGRARRDHDHQRGRRQDREPSVERRVVEHVLEELLADEHRPHQRAEHDHPGARGHPEDPPPRHVEVVERRRRAALAEHEGARGGEGDRAEPDRDRALVWHRARS